MKVFISSVTYALKDERNALPPFLQLLNYEPLRFEDFVSQDRSSREACLAGVDAADVYVLLLGPRYGDRLPDSELAPTAEEFRSARSRGIPVLVFVKSSDEPDDPAQVEFKNEVGHYVNGRLWASFADPLSLNMAVGSALKELPVMGSPMLMSPLTQPAKVPWIEGSPPIQTYGSRSPVLEAHVIPLDSAILIGATELANRAGALARDARSSSFVSDADPLEVGSDNELAWVVRPASPNHWLRQSTAGERRLSVSRFGVVSASMELPSDFMGTLVDRNSLQRDLGSLLSLAAAHVGETTEVAVAAGLSAAERIAEGDPAEIGERTSGSLRFGTGIHVRVGADFAVSRVTFVSSRGDLVSELAVRLLNDLRSVQ